MAPPTGILEHALLWFMAVFVFGVLAGACTTTEPAGGTDSGAIHSGHPSSALVLEDINLSVPLNVQIARLPGVFLSKSGELRIRRELGPPLIVIDGTQMGLGGLSMVDAADVARIEIVKGPQTASYGQRGIRGVIEVTTKHEAAIQRR